jgi:TolB-like protein/Tfp pilus assembly protein PilF
LKAANTMVTAAGSLKLVDFGLARREDALLADATRMASAVPAGVAVGTPYSMAPEQVRGGATDARTDIWALGVLLYEMVSGATPFGGATSPELFSSILRDAPIPLPRSVPADVRAVIERCLQKQPERRYPHARELRTALDAIQTGAKPVWPILRGHLGRHRLGAAAGGFAVAALLVSLSVGDVQERLRGSARAPTPIKLAVLPFENLTGDPEQEYFSDGLTEELITQLGRLHPDGLSVIARTSSMRYKKRDVSVDQIGRDLDVDYVLEGSARREGNRVRISATLIEARDQTQRWTDSFDRELSSILALQSDIALGVASSLALTLLPAEQARLATARSVNPEAYEAYLRGVSHRSRLGQADLDRAMTYFELALQKDPNYAMAYAGIALVWGYRQQMQFVAPVEAAPHLKAAIATALELDSTLAEPHYLLAGQYAWTDWNWAAAEPEFRRAIDLSPNHAEARAFYSHYLAIVGRPTEAMAQIELARQLDPASDLIQTLYGVVLQNTGRFDEAIEQFRKALETAPTSPLALNGLARSLDRAGRYEEALAAERAMRGVLGDRAALEALDAGYAEGGYRTALLRAADTLATRPGGLAPVNVAVLYLRAGENTQGLDWLERAYESRDPNLPYAAVAPFYDPIRRNPRFELLLRRMNLPE